MASIRANTAWKPDAAATSSSSVSDQLADALTAAVAVGRRRSPRRWCGRRRAPCTATATPKPTTDPRLVAGRRRRCAANAPDARRRSTAAAPRACAARGRTSPSCADLVVVDRADRSASAVARRMASRSRDDRSRPVVHGRARASAQRGNRPWCGQRPRRYASRLARGLRRATEALLAQSVEQRHGKA